MSLRALARLVPRRAMDRLLEPPPTAPGEAALGPALDALGGEVVRLRSRDGVRLAGRWLPADPAVEAGWPPAWDEAVLLLHGYTGSAAPDAVELAPFLRRTAGVLALDFRGHGASEPARTTFGLHEVEDVAGALAWLGQRGVARVALAGSSMGGIVAIAATVVLGDGRLAAADLDPVATAAGIEPRRPRIVAIVGDAVPPELRVVVRNRLGGPLRGFVADRLLDAVAERLGEDPRTLEPIRLGPLLEDVPVLLIHGRDDRTVPEPDGRRLGAALAAAGVRVEQWIVPGADHGAAHRAAPDEYEARVARFLRQAFAAARQDGRGGAAAAAGEAPAEPAGAPEPGAILAGSSNSAG